MLQRLFDEPRVERFGLPSLDCIVTGGAPVPAELLRRVERATGSDTVLLTGYGLTEATALVTLARVKLDEQGGVRRGRTIGRVLDGIELAILDACGREVSDGAIGEIAVRGPNVMAGCCEAPADTAQALQGGWLHSGDLGVRDPDGYVTIVDRLGIDPDRLNVDGGAITFGHPFGMAGSRLAGHALIEARRRGVRYAVVSMCVAGGMGSAGLFEIPT